MANYISFQPSDYFSTNLYTGTGATHNVTGVGFQPDWVWMKRRDGTSSHRLCDSVRGATNLLQSNATDAQQTDANTLTSFDSDGFTLGSDSAPYNVNVSGQTMVSWNWKAGTTSGLSGGTITPSAYSFNTTSGFSMVKYTGNSTQGATVPHGLGVAPKFIFIKATNATESWATGQGSMDSSPWDYYMYLNSTAARGQNNNRFANVSPTSTVFSIGSDASVNNSSYTYVAYCFAPKKGFSAFGSYRGNGNTDGAFVYTGFRPALVITKYASGGGTGGWNIQDNKRNTYNPVTTILSVNTDGADSSSSGNAMDFLSNGFKWRADYSDGNTSGGVFIYAAFAEFPVVSSNSKAGTAR